MNMQSNLFCARLMLLCVAPVLGGISCAIARAQESLKQLSVDIADQQIVFARLPEQEDVNLGQENISGKTPVTATYLMTTELSAAVLKELVGDEQYRAYLDNLMLGKDEDMQEPDHKSHKKKLEEAAGNIAACRVSMEQVFRCCSKLKEQILLSGKIGEVETVEVRLPTAAEWKYAMLGRKSLDPHEQYPRFPGWPTQAEVERLIASDKTLKGYVSDLQEEDPSKYAIASLSQQDRFAELLKSAAGQTKQLKGSGKTISVILRNLQSRFLLMNTKLGLTSNPVIQGDQRRDYDPREGVANDFGLLNMYNNLSEWVLMDSATIDVDWKQALKDPSGCELRFFAIGPSTFDWAKNHDAWRMMSLRDPYPADQAGKQLTLSLQEACDPDSYANEGCRMLAVRRMNANWFVTMRSKFLHRTDEAEDFIQFARSVETSIDDVVTPGPEFSQASSRLETYRILAGVSGESERPLSPEFYKTASIGCFGGSEVLEKAGDSKSEASAVQIDLGGLGGIFGNKSAGGGLRKRSGKKKTKTASADSNQKLDFFSIYDELLESEIKSN
ncbi:hypothetical protein N9018_01580 [Rhodopirellula sp.]|nr:hypothetical protein [Rhodopirellula sp.]